MDPVTQGALGAAAALALLTERVPLRAPHLAGIGALGGMAADLDVLIQSDVDPLLAIEFHRHFTHSLAFIPIGGPCAALPWLASRSLRQNWRAVLLTSTLGYATHAVLDACTTYGTLLFWPFSHTRVSLSFISVIDLLFTLPLLALVIASTVRGTPRWARVGLSWAACVMALGVVQHERAQRLQHAIARERGHVIERSAVFPTITNNVAWRSVYRSGSRYYVDKLRVPFGKTCVTPGTSVAVLANPLDDPERARRMHPASRRAERLIRWFSADWVALDPEDPSVIGDLRYSFSPGEAL
ncbi:MAG TPA: metal-dependent hydrolase, partial [Polyangiaceae bacterium]|nr:metal-dependent hydrolase [Polyangiaceae bacterium]